MTLSRAVRAVAAGVLVAFACGGSNGSQSDAGPATLDPPPNIDAVSCYDIVASDGMVSAACSGCCNQHGFPAATLYDDHCVCGDRPDATGDTACAAQASSTVACMDCCNTAGFTGHLWGGGTGVAATCRCMGRSDSAVCKSTLSAAMPSTACRTCCLNNGYLGSGYTGIGPPECQCSGP